jgi:hypothetical protein
VTRPRALFICGSINQTRQLHAVSRELPEVEAHFSPFYGDTSMALARRFGLIEAWIGGNKRRGWCLDYLGAHGLSIDLDGARGGYDLVVTCTDLVIPNNVAGLPIVVVQEGIFDRDGFVAALCRKVPTLPRWLAGTALTGESGLYARFCAASEGYRERLCSFGVRPERVVVTGMPGFDDCRRYMENDFPHRGYVLVCTSDGRETFKRDDRSHLIRRALGIAAGRPLVFKLHPNEKGALRREEIRALAPRALVFQDGSAEEMIANSDVLVTEWSSTVFVGMALGKPVYSNFPPSELRRLLPWQNGGTSAARIARVCREVLG